MFVCTGNICRSPLAHRVLEHRARERGLHDSITVESSGIGSWHVGEDADRRMRATASRHGVPFNHPARALSRSDLDSYHVIFAMGAEHEREIVSRLRRIGRVPDADTSDRGGIRTPAGTLYRFRQFDPVVIGPDGTAPAPRELAPDVPDPYYGGPEGFEEVWEMVDRTCSVILDSIAAGSFG